jgi:hypothetical protein
MIRQKLTFKGILLLLTTIAAFVVNPVYARQSLGSGSLNVSKFSGSVSRPVNPVVPPPTIRPPRVSISAKNPDLLAVALRCGNGSNVISRKQGSGSYRHFRTLNNCRVTVVRDESVASGTSYCYRLQTTFNKRSFTATTCATTPNRKVSFSGTVITAQETERVLSEFDWLKTDALPEGSAAQPILYYMNVFLDDALGAQALRKLGAHIQASPVFYNETTVWDDASALVVEDGQVTGRWYFAVMPGAVYNNLRAQLQQTIRDGVEPSIRAIVLRSIVERSARASRWDAHRLSYQYLAEQGFEFNAIRTCQIINGLKVCQKQQQILGWLLRKGFRFVAGSADAIVEKVREGFGFFKRKIKGELELALQFELLNTDPVFGSASNQPMVSGWSGQPLYLKGMTVRIRQGLASFTGKTDEFGRVNIKIARGSNSTVCIEAENKYVMLTEFLLEKLVCVENLGKFSHDAQRTVQVKHPYFNVLAQMTDTADYLDKVVAYKMDKITVLVGSWATRIAVVDDRAFTPCMGRMPNLILGGGGDILGAMIPFGLIASATAEFLYSVDIVLPESAAKSRGVGVHEYGHAVMCSMLAKQGLIDFQKAWTDVIIASSDQSGNNDTSYIVEAFADFITSQVVGGTNYFAANSVFNLADSEINYCNANNGSCMDSNFTDNAITTNDKTAFKDQVRRVATLLHDAFDGHTGLFRPNDGSHWEMRSGNSFLTQVSGNNSVASNDGENIVLQGSSLASLFGFWHARGNTITENNFLGGLADLLHNEGYDSFEICDLFSIHSSSGICPEYAAGNSLVLVTPQLLQKFSIK